MIDSEIKIMIADDHPIFREGIHSLMKTEKMFSIVGEANNGKTALTLIEKYLPQIAILDFEMPEMDGLTVSRIIKEKRLPVEIILLTMYSEERLFKTAIELGVKGYVLKDSASSDIIKAIKAVSKGKAFFSSELSGNILNGLYKPSNDNDLLNSLSPTQRRVLRFISENKSSKEIANILSISQRTVETHRAKIINKLNLHGSLSLVRYAIQHKDKI